MPTPNGVICKIPLISGCLHTASRLMKYKVNLFKSVHLVAERIAARRDGVSVLRSSLCGGLRQLGENLYTSPVHFIEELLQNADDCSP